MKKTNLLTSLMVALLVLPSTVICAEPAPRTFVPREYPSDQFKISATEKKHGNLKIKIKQAKRTKNFEQIPHSCRAWLDVEKSTKTIFSRYYDDIDAVGFSYGLFVPKTQPKSPYLAVVKNGDYDGRLFLLKTDGEVHDLLGGFYFFTKDKRYVFSEYASDASGLAVFDFVAGKVVFSSDKLPHIYQWYERNGDYFFTEEKWWDNSGTATETPNTIDIYDFKQHKIVEKKVKPAFIKKARAVKWDFDPRDFEDCTSTPNTPLEPSR